MSDFYRTGMGHQFYEGTMPALVKQLDRLNGNLEKLIEMAGAPQGVQRRYEMARQQPHENHIFQYWLHQHFKE